MDLICEEISRYINTLTDVGDVAISAAQSVIDEEVANYEKGIMRDVPVRTGGLKASFRVHKLARKNYYGYEAEFEGDAPNGTPYQKIANVINFGRPPNSKNGASMGTFFITKQIRKLRGMDARIEARINAELIKRT